MDINDILIDVFIFYSILILRELRLWFVGLNIRDDFCRGKFKLY